MVTLQLLDCGSVCKLFIKSDDLEELQRQYYSLYNRKATNGDLSNVEYINNRFVAFIWSSKKKLIQYYFNVLENKYAIKYNTEPEIGPLFYQKLLSLAESFYKNIERY